MDTILNLQVTIHPALFVWSFINVWKSLLPCVAAAAVEGAPVVAGCVVTGAVVGATSGKINMNVQRIWK